MADTRPQKRVEVSVRGIVPLLQNKYVIDKGDKPGKKKVIYDPREEAEKRLIFDGDKDLAQPASHFEGSMIRAAVDYKMSGRKTYKDAFKAGVAVEPEFIKHKITDWEIDERTAVIQRNRIMKWRPKFPEWELDFVIVVRNDDIAPLTVLEVLRTAGLYHGVGDYRPKFGLFDVTRFVVDGKDLLKAAVA